MSGYALLLLGLIALLTGANIMLIVHKVKTLRSLGKLHFILGGGSLVGIVSSGCAACGLPILSLIGLGGSIAYLPFQGLELSLIAIILLIISVYTLAKNEQTNNQCVVSSSQKNK